MGKPQQLRAILKEYDALSPGDREIRLRMSELRYYLVPLMTAPPSKRAPLLARVPAKDSKLVLDRLAKWDRLAPELQKEVLENEWMMTAITRYGQDGSSQGPAMDSMPAERRKQIEEGKKAFQQLSSEKRDRMIQNFGQVLGMDEREKARILDQVPSNQRQKMISTLQEFEKLPAKERPEVIKSLKEFTSMNPIEQARFFDDAERWSHLSETERATFRKLITQMPPLPPGLGDLPPLPLDTGDKPPFSGSIVHKP